MRFCLTIILFTLLLPVGVAASPKSLEETHIDFIYVNANAGEAAGGHTALRLGNTIYHYQFFPDSTFLLVRDHWSSFKFLYNELHNRTISVASVPIDPDSFSKIRNHFTELLVEQQQFFSSMGKLQTQVEISKAIATGKGTVAIMGLGFFKPTKETKNSTAQIRNTIETTLGMDALHYKSDENNSQTLLEALSWQEALTVLKNNHSLDPVAIILPMVGEKTLSPREYAKLQKFQQRQLKSILSLIQSSRPDRGEALLLQTARYLAVQQSLQSKQICTLDPFPDNARTIKLTAKEEELSISLLLENLLGQSSQRTKLFFQEKTHPEIAYSLLEASRARISELLHAGSRRQEVRLLPKVKLPSRSKTISLKEYFPDNPYTAKSLVDLQNELVALQREVKTKYSYNLFYRNCATELVRSLNASYPNEELGQSKLGGWLEPNSGLVFIPFLLYDKSLTAYPVDDEQILTSRRLGHLEELYANENDLLVWLRESNTLSSTLYKPRSKDTHFLFFTDDSFLLRPIQGIFNIGYASLQGVAGLFTLPFDSGERLHQSGRGIFYSLPEITFFNIRKGSYATGEYFKNLQ